MRPEVQALVKLGKMPKHEDSMEYWEEFERLLFSIEEPTTLEEAEALLQCFNDDDEEEGNGLCEFLIDKIESSGFYFKEPPDPENYWHTHIWERYRRWLESIAPGTS